HGPRHFARGHGGAVYARVFDERQLRAGFGVRSGGGRGGARRVSGRGQRTRPRNDHYGKTARGDSMSAQGRKDYAETAESTPTRILAVDDDADILYTIAAIGEAAGWHVDGASDGEEALRRLRDGGGYDLVLLDYHMPNMDGLTLLGLVREDFPTLPVLVLTVDEDQETANAFLDAGATDFALKPIKAPDLIARIRLHLRLAAAEQRLDRRVPDEELPKGIQRQTLDAIIAALREADGFISQQDLAERTGFAYQTVCRYVSHLEDVNLLDVQLKYGKLGRPKKKVRWREK